MSDYNPITGELRKVMNHTELRNVPLVELGEYEFARRCDEIDAIHAGLERENAELKAKLDLVRGKQEEHAHASGESITDELREWYKDRIFMANGWQEINDIADRIDAEHERECKEQYACGAEHGIGASIDASMIQTHGYVELPKDADGEYIHIGDRMEWVRYKDDDPTVVRTVSGIGNGVFFAWSDEQGRCAQYEAHAYRHHHAPTVEDVLREFALKVAGEECMTIRTGVVEEFAERLQLAGDAS